MLLTEQPSGVVTEMESWCLPGAVMPPTSTLGMISSSE